MAAIKTVLECIMERENNPKMIGSYVNLKVRMSAGDAHYAGELVEGAHIVTAWGDVGTELAIRLHGDESLFVGYSEVRFTAPVYAGDWMEYGGYIEKVGKTSLTCKFFAYKWMRDSKDENGNVINGSGAEMINPPEIAAYGTGTLMVKSELQRHEFADPDFVADAAAYREANGIK